MSTLDDMTAVAEPPQTLLRPPQVRMPVPPAARRTPLTWVRGGGLSRLAFLLPLLLIFGAFSWYPIARLVLISFQHTNEITTTWVGFQNFSAVLNDPLFPIAVKNTLEFAGLA